MGPRRWRQYRCADAVSRADRGPSGTVVAIEPQRAIYQLLCANLALNEVNNVHPIHAAAGQTAGRTFVPVSDYSKLIRQIRNLDYVAYWHLPPLYSPENFYRNTTNVFPRTVSIDMLCLPRSDTRKVEGMKPVTGPDDWPFPN